ELSIWGNKPWYRNQIARILFLKGMHLLSLGTEDAEEGDKCTSMEMKISTPASSASATRLTLCYDSPTQNNGEDRQRAA
ncbi:hypothetical protein QQS21_002689, partial [Conoideocrella luteorostrata]